MPSPRAGDVLIVGSHGVFDMVWLYGAASTHLLGELYSLTQGGAGAEQTSPQFLAGQVVGLASNLATTGKSMYRVSCTNTRHIYRVGPNRIWDFHIPYICRI